MFDTLRSDIEELDIPLEGRAVAEALALLDRFAAKVVRAVGELDRAKLWDVEGSTSMQAWLRDAGLSSRDASMMRTTAMRLHALPALATAWEHGELSRGQVDAVVRAVPERHVELFSSHEAEIVRALVGLSPSDTVRAMREWSARADALADTPPPEGPATTFRLSKTMDGWVADGTFDVEGGALLSKAIELADSKDFSVPAPQRRADALVTIAAFFLDNQRQHPGGRHRPHVNVIVEAEDLHERARAELVDHQLLLDENTTSRLLCDCVIHRVLVRRSAGGTAILDVAAATRTIPAALWSALVIRDRRCRFPGCDRPPTWCEGHHVQWVSHNGQTKLDNLVLLCRRHHRLLHQRPGFVAKLEADGAFHVTSPDARQRTTHPPGRPCLQ
jgi:hypothetical protein